jgi:iron complex outermembrane recepter protein
MSLIGEMMIQKQVRAIFAGGCTVLFFTSALATEFNIPSGDLSTALDFYTRQTHISLVVAGEALKGVHSNGVKGDLTDQDALSNILNGTGFKASRDSSGLIGIVRFKLVSTDEAANRAIQMAQAIPVSRAPLETVTVTSSKIGGDVQNIPIAVTALSDEQLQAQKIEGGPDLLKAIPNMTFTKTNFTGYSINIRGIGTEAVSVTTDPAVAVAFNDTAFIRNHFFEQEFFDVQSVQVLRGPQGTLYGRNATAGVVNIESAKPTDEFAGELKAEVGNYDSKRMRGFVNVPVDSDILDFRLAGSWTQRAGYAYNATTQDRIDGRNLWSTRATLGFKPFEKLHGDLIWEHFAENDNRARSTKQLCHHDSGPASLNDGVNHVDNIDPAARGLLSQGCKPGSLYDAGAYGTPNGLSIPFVFVGATSGSTIGTVPGEGSTYVGPLQHLIDPYGGMMQSPNLRVINSIIDPKYRAKSDIYELNFDYDLTQALTFTSQTGYNQDQLYSFEDFNRFNTVPVFTDSSTLDESNFPYADLKDITPGGIFCDPQIGCSNSIAGFDISQEHSTQFVQEVRLASNFSGPLNFSAGANYTRYQTLEDYYVMFNLITLLAESNGPFGAVFNSSADPTKCAPRIINSNGVDGGFADETLPLVSLSDPVASAGCIYIDTNPYTSINGQGHNYFRSENPYTLHSWAGFGEVYYQVLSDLKLTAGLRYTDDNKDFTPIPSQVLLSSSSLGAGTVDRGYPALPDIKQHWGEFTGRLVANWSPKLAFTDQTMFYASYLRGYKGGGANPPGIGYSTKTVAEILGIDFDCVANPTSLFCHPILQTLSYPAIFKPEFVNAFETGTKNTLLDGSLVLNGDVFYYDYQNYQVSQIKSRTAVNENFSAKVWGAELESTYEPLPGLRFNFAGGYQGSRIDNGMLSIDIMDRTAGNPDYVVVKPWIQLPDNCIVPKSAIIRAILV